MNKKLFFLLGGVSVCGGAFAGTVVFDNTLPGQHGPPAALTPVAGTYTIDSASGYLTGRNLFQSFLNFSIDSGQTALFTNSLQAPIGNLVSRVTGGVPSAINGTITSQIYQDPGTNKVGANFWFVNPAGVTFGKGAAVNVPAGFAVGSADYISFADGSRFYALPSHDPAGTWMITASPAAFGFLPTPASGAVVLQGNSISTTAPITLAAGPGGISLADSALTTTNNVSGGGSASGPDITLTASGGPLTLQNSTLTTNNIAEPNGSSVVAAAGSMTLGGQTVAIHGGSLSSQSLNGGNAGNLTITASGNAANAIQIDGGASLSSDANEANTAIVNGNIVSIGNAGAISLQAPTGGIAITGSTLATQAGDQNPSGAGAHAGQAGAISLNAAQLNITNAQITTMAGPPDTTGAQQDGQGVTTTPTLVPATISLQASGPVTLSGSTLSAGTNGAVAAGDLHISGGSVGVAGSTLDSRNSLWDGGSPSDPVQSTGNAGNINVTSAGEISFQGTTADSQTQTTGSGGNVRFAGSGTQGPTEGLLISGGSINTGSAPAPGIVQGNAGNVALSGPAVLLSGVSVDTSSIGAGIAGNVSITATGVSGVGAAQGGTGDALLLTGATTIAATSPSYNLETGAPPGAISLAAPAGSLRIDSGSTVTATAVNSEGGPITLLGATGITLDDAAIASNCIHGGNNLGPVPLSVTLQSSGPITLSDGTSISSFTGGGASGNNIIIQTSGAVALSGSSSLTSRSDRVGAAGNISVTGGSVRVTGGVINASTNYSGPAGNVTLQATGTDSAAGGPALRVEDGAQISSDATAGAFQTSASAGNILLRADSGTISVVGASSGAGSTTTVSSSTVSGAGGQAGTVTLAGANVSLDHAVLETTTAAHFANAVPATINVHATGSASLVDSLLDARTSGSVQAGSVLVSGGSVLISGGLPPQVFGQTTLPANTALFSGTSEEGNGGTILVSSANGPVTITNATLSTQSNSIGDGGAIGVVGSGVLIGGQSLLSANYTLPGGAPGAPGAVVVRATGTTAVNDPLQNDLNTPSAGVVRIVDSAVTAVNDGGLGGNQPGRGEIAIGSDLPGGSTALSQNVVIAGSVISNDVSAGGRGNDLSIQAAKGVWIGASPTGGYLGPVAIDPRKGQPLGNSRSLISAQTESSAVSGGQVLIAGGQSVSIVSSDVDANNAVDGSSAGSVRSQSTITINTGAGGAVAFTGSDLTTESSGMNNAGDVLVNAGSIAVSGGELSASTSGTGNAGNVSLTATGASGATGMAALQVSAGATLRSDASSGASPEANAGFVNLSAPAGTVRVGLTTDTTRTSLSTSAGASAGSPGEVRIAAVGIDLGDAQISTTTASTNPSTTRGTIVLVAGNGSGALTIANSSLDAATSGVQQAGEIDLEGSPIVISNSTISSATTGTGSAGAICVSGGGPACVAGGAATAGGLRTASKMLAAAAPAGEGSISISGSVLSTSTSTSGNAGDITVITPGALTLSGTTVASQSTSTAANAGSVGVINLSGGSVSILGGSTVSAQSSGGQAGGTGGGGGAAITINSTGGTVPLQISGSTISTHAQVVNGSNVVVNAGGSPIIMQNGVISASATGGNGGNITINDAGDTALAGSAIVAQAGPGNGGVINIHLQPGGVFVQDSGSIVSATSQSGNNGTVTINSPQTDLNSALRVPEVSAARPPELSANACRRDATHSTFVREGRGGVIPGPDGYLPLGAVAPASASAPSPSAASVSASEHAPLVAANNSADCR